MATSSDSEAQQTDQVSARLKILSDQFMATLAQYQTAQADYKTLMDSQAAAATAPPIDPSANANVNGTIGATVAGTAELYATMPHSTYWGQMGLSEGTAHTPTECLADCYNKPACTGATFDADTNYCWIRTGDGRVAPGKTNQTAIVKKTILYRDRVNILTQKLEHLRGEIDSLISANVIIIENNAQLRAQRETLLAQVRHMGGIGQTELAALKIRHDTIAEATQNSALLVNQNYSQYILYLFGAILLGIFLFKILMIPTASSSSAETASGIIRGGGGRVRSHTSTALPGL